MLKINYSSNLEDNFYEIIAKSKADKFKGLTFEEYYNNHYKKTFIYDLKDIYIAPIIKKETKIQTITIESITNLNLNLRNNNENFNYRRRNYTK